MSTITDLQNINSEEVQNTQPRKTLTIPGPYPLTLICTLHALDQMKNRKIDLKMIQTGLLSYPFLSYKKRVVFPGSQVRVITSLDGTIITVTKNVPLYRYLDQINGDQNCKNRESLIDFYKKVREGKNHKRKAKACYNLGMLFKKMTDIRSTHDQGWKYLEEAYEHGHPSAAFKLLSIGYYLNGVDLELYKKRMQENGSSFLSAFLGTFSDKRELIPAYLEFLKRKKQDVTQLPHNPQPLSYLAVDEFFRFGSGSKALTYTEKLASYGSPFAAIMILSLLEGKIVQDYPSEKVDYLKNIIDKTDPNRLEELFLDLLEFSKPKKSTFSILFEKKTNEKKQYLIQFGISINSLICCTEKAKQILNSEVFNDNSDFGNFSTQNSFLVNLLKKSPPLKEFIEPLELLFRAGSMLQKLHFTYHMFYHREKVCLMEKFVTMRSPLLIHQLRYMIHHPSPLDDVQIKTLEENFNYWKGKHEFSLNSKIFNRIINLCKSNKKTPKYKELSKEIDCRREDANGGNIHALLELGMLEFIGINPSNQPNPQKGMQYIQKIIEKYSEKLNQNQKMILIELQGLLFLDPDLFNDLETSKRGFLTLFQHSFLNTYEYLEVFTSTTLGRQVLENCGNEKAKKIFTDQKKKKNMNTPSGYL